MKREKIKSMTFSVDKSNIACKHLWQHGSDLNPQHIIAKLLPFSFSVSMVLTNKD
uniref:Uncharacterized protein n=1 Tax=Rhizophora mucronata TaxID=61149 RepID=A0A2P2IKX1_RHIMU